MKSKNKKRNFFVSENFNDKFKLTATNDSVNFYIPYRRMIDKNTLLLKNGGFARVFEIINKDLDYVDDIDKILKNLNETLKEVNSGVVFHYETQKIPVKREEEKISEFSPIPTIIGHKMRSELFKKKKFYKIRHYLTISYLYDYTKEKNIDEFLFNEGIFKKKDYLKQFDNLIKEFNRKLEDILFRLEYAVLDIKVLENSELLNFLYRTINPNLPLVNLKVPPLSFPIDEWLSCSQMKIENGAIKANDSYTKVVSIKLFPSEVVPQIFSELEKLKFSFRSVTRLIGLSKEEAISSIKNIEKYQFGKRYNMIQIVLNAFNNTRGNIDNGNENRIKKTYEAKYAREELEADKVSYGYYTFAVIISDKNLKKLNEKVNLVIRIINRHGFTCLDDKLNVKDAYFGAMPSNIKQNMRKSPMNSESLGYMLPISSVFEGNDWDERINAPNLFDTITNDRIFHFNNKVDKDVGHTLVLGPTGKGKSVLLGTMVLNFLKYESKIFSNKNGKNYEKSPAQVFVFDKGASSKVLTMASGGRFYDLGSENHMAFQPLRNIHKLKDMEFAMDWVMGLIAQEDENLAKDVVNRKKIYDALLSLAKMESKMRTISTLVKLVQIPKLKEALRVYSQEGIYGSYFDSNSDVIENTNFLTFEMGAIMEKPKVLLSILEYLFFKIENEKLGKDIPTLIILDECWVFLRHERMKAKIEEWLKVLRKANAEVVFATQSLNDIEKSSIAPTIKDACMTKIFLPNENALSTHKKLYEGYNLSQIAISTIDKAFGQRQYLYNSKYGTRLFELNLSKLELAYVGAGDDTSKSVIENLSNIYLEKYSKIEDEEKYLRNLNKDYLKYKYEENKISFEDLQIANKILEK